jgi:hypothetical protein
MSEVYAIRAYGPEDSDDPHYMVHKLDCYNVRDTHIKVTLENLTGSKFSLAHITFMAQPLPMRHCIRCGGAKQHADLIPTVELLTQDEILQSRLDADGPNPFP